MKLKFLVVLFITCFFSGFAKCDNDIEKGKVAFPIKAKFFSSGYSDRETCFNFLLSVENSYNGLKLDNFGIGSKDSGSESFVFRLALDESNSSYVCMPIKQVENVIVFADYGYSSCTGATYSFQLKLKDNLSLFRDYSDGKSGRASWIKNGEPHDFSSLSRQ
jgi:hypothetical protein